MTAASIAFDDDVDDDNVVIRRDYSFPFLFSFIAVGHLSHDEHPRNRHTYSLWLVLDGRDRPKRQTFIAAEFGRESHLLEAILRLYGCLNHDACVSKLQ
jgi:hypothetical protein